MVLVYQRYSKTRGLFSAFCKVVSTFEADAEEELELDGASISAASLRRWVLPS